MKDFINIGNDKINCLDTVFKSRLLIINPNNEILLANYGGVYLLPGGKLEENEDFDMALVREIREEVGSDFFNTNNYNLSNIQLLVQVTHYQENFISRDGNVKNKRVITQYYYLYTDYKFDLNGNNLSESEKKDNFCLKFVDIDNIDNIIENNLSLNPRKKYFDIELLRVIDYFKKNYMNNSKVYKKTVFKN